MHGYMSVPPGPPGAGVSVTQRQLMARHHGVLLPGVRSWVSHRLRLALGCSVRSLFFDAAPHRQNGVRCWELLLLTLFTPHAHGLAAPADDAVRQDAAVSRQFNALDGDHDQFLSLSEYTENADDRVAQRDFQLFDQNQDGKLTLAEYQAIPILGEAGRGYLPDPLQLLVDQAVAAMDESFDNWDENPQWDIDVRQFVIAFAATLGPNASRPEPREADEDGDGRVSRREARRFMEIQLGVRKGDGEELRQPDGRVTNLAGFQSIDSNQDHRLDRAEFLRRADLKGRGADLFQKADENGDGALSLDEWRQLPRRGVLDPVNDFRQFDKNLDALLDADELLAGTPAWKQPMAKAVFPGFDMDGNGKLSLLEYRLTMQANPVLPWQQLIWDDNGDGRLTFDEFQFGETVQFPLLRWVYFKRLDIDQSDSLSLQEFAFRVKVENQLYSLSAEGSDLRPLLKLDGYQHCGSPDVSPDGTLVALDCRKVNPRTPYEIFIVGMDGSDPRRLCTGSMPTWSPDGTQLAFSRSGVRVIDVDGANERVISPRGWGGQWSPDGTQIAFYESREIKSYDVATGKVSTLLRQPDHPYASLYWNMEWSPDGKRLCFKGRRSDGSEEVATVRVSPVGRDPDLRTHFSLHAYIVADFAWHPSGTRVVFSATCPERNTRQLYEFHPDRDDPATLVKGQDATRNNIDQCWTPDGERLVFASGDF